MNKFRITIASLPDRENLVAEISYDGFQFAEISQETDKLMIQFYSHPKNAFWEFPFHKTPHEEILEIIEKAKKRLIEIK